MVTVTRKDNSRVTYPGATMGNRRAMVVVYNYDGVAVAMWSRAEVISVEFDPADTRAMLEEQARRAVSALFSTRAKIRASNLARDPKTNRFTGKKK